MSFGFLGALAALPCLVLTVWLARVYDQVDRIRSGELDPEHDSVIGAARWWSGL